jgi:hypothetical protein
MLDPNLARLKPLAMLKDEVFNILGHVSAIPQSGRA